jgi:DNA-binding beta-propeller fold protein YncE
MCDGELFFSTGLAFGPDGNLYVVADDENILHFDGTTGACLGVYASGADFDYAAGLAFGSDGNLYVGNRNTHQVLRFEGPGLDSDGDGVLDADDVCPYEDATGFDVDGDGCLDSMSGLAEMLDTLVSEGVIAEELRNSLISKVENAEKSASKDNICAAVHKVEALIHEVNAQRGKKISDEAADDVIAYAESVIARLLAQLPPGESC